MPEHVMIFGNGYDVSGRIRAAAATSGQTCAVTVMCWLEHLSKVEDAEGNATIVAMRADAPADEWIRLARAVHEVEPVTRIGTFGDQCQDRAAAVGAALGVYTHSPQTVRLVFDKHAMRQRLAEAGVDVTPATVVADPAELNAFTSEHGYPCVVKPLAGTSSRGVSVVRGEGDVAAAFVRPKRPLVASGSQRASWPRCSTSARSTAWRVSPNSASTCPSRSRVSTPIPRALLSWGM